MATEEQRKFTQTMLKQAEKKEESRPQSRTEGVDRSEVEKFTEMLLNPRNRKK